ncbi:dermonecrotic toxin domain-containing protein [Pseudomonas poae]|uniref:Dermonecrotic toxin N-terminal domain-containing protein n=1 Tax=Pseudomonas poae TaxID=200451 RepID=A0A2S9EBP0_9PSED|nr:DUF6543 domain-containing protein [Pseudomonas poae]PRA25784.1 hypothetical protein CQZ97_22530 [Pseudomonas poae]PRC12348.1 hypothetical protein CQZ99_23265 [Pseudomonas poae]
MSTSTPTPSMVAQTVSARFASRPTLESVTRTLLTQAISAHYPTLHLDLALTQLASPHAGDGWTLQPLMPKVLEYLALGTPLDFQDSQSRPYYLTDRPPTRLAPAGGSLDMQLLAELIRELRWSVPIGLQDALTAYWNEDGRWQWLGNLLRDTLQSAALKQTELSDLARDTLQQVIDCPDYEQRLSRYNAAHTFAYSMETRLHSGAEQSVLPSVDVVLVRNVNSHTVVLLCEPGGPISAFDSIDAFNRHWTARITRQYTVDSLSYQRYEIQGHLFDNGAALILNQQLKSLEALRLPTTLGTATLQALCAELSDPGYYFTDAAHVDPARADLLRPHLPAGLLGASADDLAVYRHYLLALASSKVIHKGRTFLSGINDLHAFTREALLTAMKQQRQPLDASTIPAPDPDKVLLTFTQYAGYPGAPGIVDTVQMSLTELAVKNLIGRPGGTLTVKHSEGLALPDWLSADYISRRNGLIEQADIGKTYPDYLKQQLLADTPDARERERLFADQLRAQLPLQALELHLNNEAGVSAIGARYVAALVRTNGDRREVDGQPVVIRCLALLRKPEAKPDVVANMFIIEALDIRHGPHLLYRPLYAQPLREFSSRDALLAALAEPGELQASVLTWLSDEARAVYDNGGFQEPHYIRFGQGDEFATLTVPPPAQLANDGASLELLQYLDNGRLMQYLYGSNARALIDQASHDSVSNHTSRWRALVETGSVLFSALLLPLLRGPAMLTGWLLTLMAAAQHDIQALNSSEPVTRELASADVLLNLAMLLFEVAPRVTGVPPMPPALKDRALLPPAPPARAEQWPIPRAALLNEGTVAIAEQLTAPQSSLLELGFASARNRLTQAQRARLARLRAGRPATLPDPVLNGPRKGLYVINRAWYVMIETNLYQVRLDPDGNAFIVNSFDTSQRGPQVRPDAQGHWSIDLNLRLLGGMPPKRVAAERERKAQRKIQLQDQYSDFVTQQVSTQRAIDIAQSVMEIAEQDPRYSAEQRAGQRRQFDSALQRQTALFQQLLDTREERVDYNIPLNRSTLVVLMENTVNNARKSVIVSDKDRNALYATYPGFTQGGTRLRDEITARYGHYVTFIKALDEINERAINALDLKDRQLEALYNLGDEGVRSYERLTANRPEGEVSSLGVKQLRLLTLRVLSVKDVDLTLMDSFNAIIEPLNLQLRSHLELTGIELSPVERKDLLESLVQHYGQALDALQGMAIVNAEELEHTAFDTLLKMVEKLYEDAALQLSKEFKPDPLPRQRPPKRPKISAGRPQKKLIKTRSGNVLIGDLQPAGTRLSIDVVEMRSAHNNDVIGTYSRHGEVWDEVRVQAEPQTPPPTRPLNVIKGDARKLFRQLEGHLSGAERYKQQCRHAVEIEELMNHEAARLDKLATELDQALLAQPEAARIDADRHLVDEMRQGATRLKNKGHELRIALSLHLPPTHGALQFLFDQHLVQVARLGERIAMKGARKDFIQEYAINDRKGYPLWYAHFHYPTAHTAKADYSVAHIKTVAQRRESYYTLLDRAHTPQAIVDVHRALLGRALAEQKFLPLAP